MVKTLECWPTDIDSDSDVLTAVLLTTTQNGNLTFRTDGSFKYTPVEDYNGSDSFTYYATDGENISETGHATIIIGNQAPVAEPNEYITQVDTLLEVPTESGVLLMILTSTGTTF